MHFPQALTNHRHNICVEDNNLTTKQQTKDLLPNSKPKTCYQTENRRPSKQQTEMRANIKHKIEKTANGDASKVSFPCTRYMYNPLWHKNVTKFKNVMSLPPYSPVCLMIKSLISSCLCAQEAHDTILHLTMRLRYVLHFVQRNYRDIQVFRICKLAQHLTMLYKSTNFWSNTGMMKKISSCNDYFFAVEIRRKRKFIWSEKILEG